MSTLQPKAEHVPLRGSRRYHRAGAQVMGRCDGQDWCEVTVKVRRKAALPEPVPGKPISRAELHGQVWRRVERPRHRGKNAWLVRTDSPIEECFRT